MTLDEGDRLIIGGDWNNSSFYKGRGTSQTNTRGSQTIDEIFASETIDIYKCGYLDYGVIQSDHRILWVDFVKPSAIGTTLNHLSSPNARRLKTTDLRIVRRYHNSLDAFFVRITFMDVDTI